MTDNDDPEARLAKPPPDGQGKDEVQGSTVGPAQPPSLSQGPGAHTSRAAATDPEVPSAKRRGALRRLRSLFGLAAVVMGLLSITFSLLYRAGRRVGVPRSDGEPTQRRDGEREPVDGMKDDDSNASAIKLMRSDSEIDDAPSQDERATERSPAASAPSAGKRPPTRDIIRTPAF